MYAFPYLGNTEGLLESEVLTEDYLLKELGSLKYPILRLGIMEGSRYLPVINDTQQVIIWFNGYPSIPVAHHLNNLLSVPLSECLQQ